MEPPGGRDSRFNLGYSMNLLSGDAAPEIYGNPSLGRPSTSLQQLSPRHTMVSSACGGRGLKPDIYDERGMSSQSMGLESCVNDISEDTYSSMQSKKSPPSNGKKTKGRVKIKMEYIENKLRRYTTFSKRKTGIMKKAYELSTLTGTQVMLLVASETGHVYTFATRKLQPMITSEAGKALIQTCLNSPDPPVGSAGGEQRMSATGFEETELTYNISDDDSKEGESGSDESSDEMEQNEENSNPSEDVHISSDPLPSPAGVKDKVSSKEKDVTISLPTTASLISSALTSKAVKTLEENNQRVEKFTQRASELPKTTSTTLNTSLPLFIPTTVPSTGTQSTGSSGTTTSQIQALPLLLQTPNGMGYASTPDGMILGLLQGPNMVQPQLVALPIAPSLMQNLAKNEPKEEKS